MPACTQMALTYLGILRTQEELARALKVRSGFGAPASNIVNLRSQHIDVSYHLNGTWDNIRSWLQRQIPVIACVQAGELPHWQGVQAQHAVLVVGMDEQNVYLHDPALDQGPVAVAVDGFYCPSSTANNSVSTGARPRFQDSIYAND